MNQKRIITLDADELQAYEPNRYPFLFIDRVTECVPGEYAKGYKNFTQNEWFFPKHYKGHAFVPGVVQLEALSQILTIPFTTLPEVTDVNVRGFRCSAVYHKEVKPGDRLDIEAFVTSYNRGVGKGFAKSYVDGELACELKELTLIIPCIFNQFRRDRMNIRKK